MSSLRLAVVSSLLAASAQATTYKLADRFDASNFFKSFTFFDAADPTHGFVDYVDAAAASKAGLAGYVNGQIYLGADHQTAHPSGGRASTRVTSNAAWEKGLFVADIAHMPVGCGVWPALWTLGGPDWPAGGEIDIIEGVNSATTDAITLHTSAGCTMSNSGSAAGTTYAANAAAVDCNAGAGSQGCSLQTTNTAAYGPGFNAAGGGVYVMELTSAAISVWFFARGSAGAAAVAGAGDSLTVASLGNPVATFSGCDIDAHFAAQQIILDTTFCGDWAGEVWADDATCAPLAGSCEAYVSANPAAFTEAYWLINSIQVYQASGSAKRAARQQQQQEQQEQSAEPRAAEPAAAPQAAAAPLKPEPFLA